MAMDKPRRGAWRALEELKESSLRTSQLVPLELVDSVISIVGSWVTQWENQPEAKSFLQHKRFTNEMEESIVTISVVISYLERLEKSMEELEVASPPYTVFDMCSGKGYMATLLAYLTPKHTLLRRWIKSCVMVDSRTDTDYSHVGRCNDDPSTISLTFVSASIYSTTIDTDMGVTCDTRGILVGIHLCNRLSPRCVEIFSNVDRMDLLILSPCCIPFSGQPILLNGRQLIPKTLRPNTSHKRDRKRMRKEQRLRENSKNDDGTTLPSLESAPEHSTPSHVAHPDGTVGDGEDGSVPVDQHSVNWCDPGQVGSYKKWVEFLVGSLPSSITCTSDFSAPLSGTVGRRNHFITAQRNYSSERGSFCAMADTVAAGTSKKKRKKMDGGEQKETK